MAEHVHQFGRTDAPIDFRGLVVSSPLRAVEGRIEFSGTLDLDPQELRMSLLFWDRLLWPRVPGIGWPTNQDARFLEGQGILWRPGLNMSGDVSEMVARAQWEAFFRADSEAPGCWAVSQGVNSVVTGLQPSKEGRGLLMTLYSAIPVPDQAVPLNEILDFKRAHQKTLKQLRMEVEGLYGQVLVSSDAGFSVNHAMEKIDAGCAEAVRAAKTSGFPLRLSDLKTSFKIPIGAAAVGAFAGWEAGLKFQLPEVGALLGSALSCLSVGWDIVPSSLGARQTPYRYVTQFHKDVFY